MKTSITTALQLAENSDLDQIIRIWKQGWNKNNPDWQVDEDQIFQFIDNFKKRNGFFNFWVVKEFDQVLGWVSVLPAFYHPMKEKSEAEISIYMDSQIANKGFGTKLTTHVLNQIQYSTINNVWAFVTHDNLSSKNMCQRAGMQICGQTSSRLILIKEYKR